MRVPFALVRDLSAPDEASQGAADEDSAALHTQTGLTSGSTEALWEVLREIEDPELPISVVDMGLIVALVRQEGVVSLQVTFTAMGCPAMEMILGDIRDRLLQEPGVEQIKIEVVWDPPWTPARMTEEGRDTLRMWGIGL